MGDVRTILNAYVTGTISRGHAMAELGLEHYQELLELMGTHDVAVSEQEHGGEKLAARLMRGAHVAE